MNGSELLTTYRESGSEQAFSDLVGRYANLVFSIARRRLNSVPLAEEATQTVFTRLARLSSKFRSDAELVAWLHRTTVHVAIDAWRTESRRSVREQQAVAMETNPAEDLRLWDEIAPCLDECLDDLRDDDRQAVLMRFFEKKSMREIGVSLGVGEDAAKMRVSRALDRLRTRLAARGVTCAAAALGVLITRRSVEAAPETLVATLRAMKLAVPAGVIATIGARLIALIPKGKLAVVAAVLVVGVGLVILLRPHGGRVVMAKMAAVPTRTETVPLNTPKVFQKPDRSRAFNTPAETNEIKTKFRIRVVDSESGSGISGAKVKVVYFYPGGIGEGHDLLTDANGLASAPDADQPNSSGPNIFYGADGYVPISENWFGKDIPEGYTVKLEPAASVGGVVVDEVGKPVAGVKVGVHGPGNQPGKKQNIDLRLATAISDDNGRWLLTGIPKEYGEIHFILTCDGYAVACPRARTGETDLLNLELVIDRGATVVGRITDADGDPIRGAVVRELHDAGYKHQSTKTDDKGNFVIRGLTGELNGESRTRPAETNQAGGVRFRGNLVLGRPPVYLAVQVRHFAPQIQKVSLAGPTNVLNFTLSKAAIFRGRVVDEKGRPIFKASVSTDGYYDLHVMNRFEWNSVTDEQGHFEWDSAPPDEILYRIEAYGYKDIRGFRHAGDGSDFEIRMTPGSGVDTAYSAKSTDGDRSAVIGR